MKKAKRWFKKYFIPHLENDFKPHFLRHESWMISLLVILVVELGFLAQVFIVFDRTNFLASVLPGVLASLTNEERAQNDAPPLTESSLLDKAAEMKAQDMATRGYFAHTSPDGKTPWYWLDQVGYSYTLAGENLAVNFFESEQVAEAWMNSPTHRANIVKKDYTEIGIGVASGIYEGRNTVFVAQFFGTPLKIVPITIPEPDSTSSPQAEPTKTPAPTKSTTPVKTTPKTTTPKTTPKPAPKPAPVIPTPSPTPSPVTPPVVAVAPAPTTVQILGEETTIPTPAPTPNSSVISSVKSFIQRALTSPDKYVSYAYGAVLLLVLSALALTIFIRFEIQHSSLVARGATLIGVVVLLLIFNTQIFHVDTKVPSSGLSATVINSTY